MSEKRNQTETNPLEAQHKRAKGAINSIVKEYQCPIALELPVDPVTANDGHVYNRADIQKHIDNSREKDVGKKKQYRNLKSPMTKQPMGPELLPTIQVRNSIRELINSGEIDGNEGNAHQWKYVDDLRTRALGEDPSAMMIMAGLHLKGKCGIMKDDEKMYWWLSKAANLGYPSAIGKKGSCLFSGSGTTQNKSEGFALMGIAAAKGHGESQFNLGLARLGQLGFSRNLSMAKHWLQKTVDHDVRWHDVPRNIASPNSVACAKELLEVIKKKEEGVIDDEAAKLAFYEVFWKIGSIR